MAAKKILFYLSADYTLLPRWQGKNTKEALLKNEGSWSNKHKNKTIFFWPPFMHSVYTTSFRELTKMFRLQWQPQNQVSYDLRSYECNLSNCV